MVEWGLCWILLLGEFVVEDLVFVVGIGSGEGIVIDIECFEFVWIDNVVFDCVVCY